MLRTLLRMPLHPDGEAPADGLDRLDDAVLRPGRDGQLRSDSGQGLVVVTGHRRGRPEQAVQLAPGLRAHVTPMVEPRARVVDPRVLDVREVLDEIAAEGDVQQLHAAADG